MAGKHAKFDRVVSLKSASTHAFVLHHVALASAALFYLIWQYVLDQMRGPTWLMIPQDIGYTYLFNGINALVGAPVGMLIHPGITVTLFDAAGIRLLYTISGSGDLPRHVIDNAELYQRFLNYSVSLIGAIALYGLGAMTPRGTRSVRLALSIQLVFLVPSAVILYMNSFAVPEAFQMICAMLLVGLTLRHAECGWQDARGCAWYAGLTAAICGFALATKFTSAPLLLLPFSCAAIMAMAAGFRRDDRYHCERFDDSVLCSSHELEGVRQ